MNLVGYRTYARLHRLRRALRNLPPSGEDGDLFVGFALITVCSVLGVLLAGRLL